MGILRNDPGPVLARTPSPKQRRGCVWCAVPTVLLWVRENSLLGCRLAQLLGSTQKETSGLEEGYL